jgi:DNA-binding CsgD family transcriptional regulator
MTTRPTTADNRRAAPKLDSGARVADLIRIIVNTMGVMTPDLEPGAERILLDTDLDGERYLLVRMPRPGRKHASLSPRELEIVRMVADGHSNKIIADVLNISSWTVCTHVRRIFAKLGVGSRAAMVARLIEGEKYESSKAPGVETELSGFRISPFFRTKTPGLDPPPAVTPTDLTYASPKIARDRVQTSKELAKRRHGAN